MGNIKMISEKIVSNKRYEALIRACAIGATAAMCWYGFERSRIEKEERLLAIEEKGANE